MTLKARWWASVTVATVAALATLILWLSFGRPRSLFLLYVCFAVAVVVYRHYAFRCPSCGRSVWAGDRDRLRWPMGPPNQCHHCKTRLE